MSARRVPATLLAAFALLPALLPGAAASPCASPCGEVEVINTCAGWSATAEGAGGGLGTVWVFTVRMYVDGALLAVHSQSSEGPVAAFQSSGTGTPTGALWVYASLHADGRLVDDDSAAC